MNYQVLETIKQAARARKVLRIIYVEKDGTSEGWRYVEPYSFSGDEHEKALFAWDLSKNGIRRFVLSRIDSLEITENSFMPRYTIEIN